jgi:threonylcarbamoyladenosine tRNA methylthiotransferase MtaB
MAGKYVVSTLGCKVNQYETQQLREVLEACGFHAAQEGEPASIAVINTCAVTAEAARKNRRAVRQLSCGGRTPVVVVGCGASADAQRLGRLAGVAAVFGHDADVSVELRKLLERCFPVSDNGPVEETAVEASQPTSDAGGKNGWIKPAALRRNPTSDPIVSVQLPVVKTDQALLGRIESFRGHQRAFLKVQDGCDAHCSYCIIPRLRPNLRSKPIEEAVAEARGLVRAGYREIVLTGIFLGAYGRPTALRKRFGPGQAPLAELVQALAGVEGLARLRLSSLEPGDVDDDLLEVLAARGCCVPHLHLPLQSGSPEVLRRMNRQYTGDAYVAMVDRVRAALDRPSITTDIIVGFPGETEADFEATLQIARYAEFSKIHAFPFSSREGTAAARWQKEFVPPAVMRERMTRLADVERECSLRYRRRLLGLVERVIVEPDRPPSPWERGRGEGPSPHIRHGRSDRYFEVHFEPADEVRTGDLVPVRIDHVTPGRTHGTGLRRQGPLPLTVLTPPRPRG